MAGSLPARNRGQFVQVHLLLASLLGHAESFRLLSLLLCLALSTNLVTRLFPCLSDQSFRPGGVIPNVLFVLLLFVAVFLITV
jgi:hypothetical protein